MLHSQANFRTLLAVLVLLQLLLVSLASAGTVKAVNRCSYDLSCAIVKGCPQGQTTCPGAIFKTLKPGGTITTTTGEWPDDIGIALQCGIGSNPTIVSQAEWTRKTADGKVHYDLSNVKGAVFVREGMTMYVDKPRTNELPTCYGAVCLPGQNPCPYIYNTDYQDKRGMRACTKDVNIEWHMCLADRNLVLPAPGTGTV